MQLSIVDYGVGNLKSLQNAIRFVGSESTLASQPGDLLASDKLILPGVGAFGYAMTNIKKLALDTALKESCLAGTPILGICLGMQLLLSASEENGVFDGLNFIPGQVKKLDTNGKIPHMGWNRVHVHRDCDLTENLPRSNYAYFVHSYICIPENTRATVATADYGDEFSAIISHQNVFGCQFHPEKSQEFGLQILKNFAEI